MSDLASAFVLSQSGTTRALQRAERYGNIRRRPDRDDGRAVVIELTDAGRDVVEKAM
jgi:DNA-binding MarR family transcriptional regulator